MAIGLVSLSVQGVGGVEVRGVGDRSPSALHFLCGDGGGHYRPSHGCPSHLRVCGSGRYYQQSARRIVRNWKDKLKSKDQNKNEN